MRHRRGAAAAGQRDLVAGLRHQRDVLPELAEGPRRSREPAAELGDPVALALPLRRVAEPERRGQRRPHRAGPVAELLQRAGRAAELHDEHLRAQGSSRARWRTSGPRQLAMRAPTVIGIAACIRVRPISVRPPNRASSASSAATTASSRAARTGSAAFSRSTSAVSITSWLVAPKCTRAACGSPTAARSCRTSSGTTTPSRAVRGRERCHVGAEAGERGGDGRGRVGRDDPGARLRRGERGLEGEHRGELGLRADQRRDLGVADEAASQG